MFNFSLCCQVAPLEKCQISSRIFSDSETHTEIYVWFSGQDVQVEKRFLCWNGLLSLTDSYILLVSQLLRGVAAASDHRQLLCKSPQYQYSFANKLQMPCGGRKTTVAYVDVRSRAADGGKRRHWSSGTVVLGFSRPECFQSTTMTLSRLLTYDTHCTNITHRWRTALLRLLDKTHITNTSNWNTNSQHCE